MQEDGAERDPDVAHAVLFEMVVCATLSRGVPSSELVEMKTDFIAFVCKTGLKAASAVTVIPSGIGKSITITTDLHSVHIYYF